MKRDRHDTPEKVGKFSDGGGKKWVPLWMKRTVTVTPKAPVVETVKKTYSFSFNFGWLWELALMAAIIYLLCQSCSVTVIAH